MFGFIYVNVLIKLIYDIVGVFNKDVIFLIDISKKSYIFIIFIYFYWRGRSFLWRYGLLYLYVFKVNIVRIRIMFCYYFMIYVWIWIKVWNIGKILIKYLIEVVFFL